MHLPSWFPLRPRSQWDHEYWHPKTGNKKLDKQIRNFRLDEAREPPVNRPLTPERARQAHQLMLDACDGNAPSLPRTADEERRRNDFVASLYDWNEPIAKPPKDSSKSWIFYIKFFIIYNLLATIILRIIVLAFTLTTLILSISLYKDVLKHHSTGEGCNYGADVLFLLIWSSISCVVTIGTIVDDFVAPPIGLRSPTVVLLRTLSEVFFIMFQASAAAVAFGVYDIRTNCSILYEPRLKMLGVLLLIGGVAWASAHSIIVCRFWWWAHTNHQR